MLVQPKNDYLLFAYFGFSLQVRRRSLKADLRGRLATKRKLAKVVGDIAQRNFRPILLRNALDDTYPWIDDATAFRAKPQWRYFMFLGHSRPDHLAFLANKFYAYVDDAGQRWDYDKRFDKGWPRHPELVGLERESRDEQENEMHSRWWQLPERNRAALEIVGFVHYDRVLAVDELGDRFHQGPHLFIEFSEEEGPFDGYQDWVKYGADGSRNRIRPTKDSRGNFLPDVLPPLKQAESTDGDEVI